MHSDICFPSLCVTFSIRNFKFQSIDLLMADSDVKTGTFKRTREAWDLNLDPWTAMRVTKPWKQILDVMSYSSIGLNPDMTWLSTWTLTHKSKNKKLGRGCRFDESLLQGFAERRPTDVV